MTSAKFQTVRLIRKLGVFLFDSFFLTIGVISSQADVLINEIAYHPITDSSAEEFIEVFNTGPGAVDLSGWALDGAGYTFPASTTISASDCRVVAKNPTALSALHPGLSNLLGPYPGQLRNSGEGIRLINTSDQMIDSVDYLDALPWPTAADGDGPTLELRNPELDNSAPESWAASDLTYDASAGWETIDVTLNSVAGDFFFFLADHDGAGWIGDAVSIHLLFDDFHLEDLSAPGINLLSDGGFESGDASDWNLTGTLHAGFASPEEACSGKYCYHYWSLESGNATSRKVQFQPAAPLTLSSANTYRFTARYKVIHGSARVSFGAGTTVGAGPMMVAPRAVWGTPGEPNSVLRPIETPILREVKEIGPQLTPSVSEEIVATFNDISIMDSVELCYSVQQIGFTGPVPTPDEVVWQCAAMTADASPNQTSFRAIIPGQAANSIVRYYLKWTDTSGGDHRYPHRGSYPRNLIAYVPGPAPDYGVPNFFLHLVPEYHQFFFEMLTSGELAPGTSGIFRFNRPTFPATFIDLSEGEIYEDVQWKPRGWDNLNNALSSGFRVGVSLQFRPGYYHMGSKRELDLNNNRSRRNEAGIRTRLAHEVYRRAGVPAPRTRYVWLNQNGIEMGLLLDIESPDNEWLSRWGRDGDGSLYKARWSYRGPFFLQNLLLRGNESVYASLENYEHCYLKKNRRNSNHSDLIEMIRGLNAPALTGRVFDMDSNGSDVSGQRDFLDTRIDFPNVLKKYGVDSVLANHDRGQQNHYLYQDVARDGRWETYPWDLDLTWNIGTQDLWNTLGQFPGGGMITEDPAFDPDWWFYEAEPFFTRLMAVPEHRESYVVGIRDQLRSTFSERQLFATVEDYGQEGLTAFERDKAIWPQVSGPGLNVVAEDFKDRVKQARQAAFWRARTEDLDGYPIPPVLSDGRTDPMVPSPSDPIQFRVTALSAGTTNLSEGIDTVTLRYRLNGGGIQTVAMVRAGFASHDGDYLQSVTSQTEGTLIEYWFETMDDLGLTDRLPETGSFFTEVVGNPIPSASLITITEIMYHSDLRGNEWVEIQNLSSRYVDVSGWSLGDSSPEHRFRFPVDLVLAPGERLAVAANEFVVREHYGIDNVVGDFAFNFGNGGDTVSVFNSIGTLIDTVVYSDLSPWPAAADGEGPSLELMDNATDNSDPANWLPSTASRGTPGQSNGGTGMGPAVVINECSYDPNDQGTTGDYNGDGIGEESEDEFVEFYNTTDTPIDISGWTVDDDNPGNLNTFTFPMGTILDARSYVVVFGGGTPTGFSVPTFIGLPRLGNGGDQVRLHDGTQEVDSIGFEDSAIGTQNNLMVSSNGGVVARITDGSPDFEARDLGQVTVGASNNLNGSPTPTPTPPPLDVSSWQFY